MAGTDRPGPTTRRRRVDGLGIAEELPAARRRHVGPRRQAVMGNTDPSPCWQETRRTGKNRHASQRRSLEPAVQDRSADRSKRPLRAVRHFDERADVRFHPRRRIVQRPRPAAVQPRHCVSRRHQPGAEQDPPVLGRMGAVMLKTSWRVLDPVNDKDLLARFHTADTLIYFPGPPDTAAGPTCVEKRSDWSASTSAIRPMARRNGSGAVRTRRQCAGRIHVAGGTPAAALQFLQRRLQEDCPSNPDAAAAVGSGGFAAIPARTSEAKWSGSR